MSRELMPKSGIMMPHVVVTRDAAVVGVSTVDGKAGAIDLVSMGYAKAADYYKKDETYTKGEVDNLITPIMQRALFKDDPFINNDVALRSGGGNGIVSVDMIKVDPNNNIIVGDYDAGVQGVHIYSEGKVDVVYKDSNGQEKSAPLYSDRFRPPVADLPFAAIGQYVTDPTTGRTVGVNRTGENSDLKTLNALTNIKTTKVTFEQSPTVPDGSQPYDAVNLRQLQASGGGGGANMSGVMNNFIGAVEWFNGSRARLPAGYIAADGQEESQTDPKTSDLYVAINSDMYTTVLETAWQSDVNLRGSYVKLSSSGKFRVPDLNGMQPGSISANFLRSSGTLFNVGTIQQNSAPDITGDLSPLVWISNSQNTSNGAFTGVAGTPNLVLGSTGGASFGQAPYFFKASNSNAAYGRNGATEIRPNSAVGFWIIRASGGFTSANTSWEVINSDATEPSSGTTTYGGDVWSTYKVAGSDYVKLGYRAKITIGGVSTGEIRLVDSRTGGASKTWAMPAGSGTLLSTADVGTTGNNIPRLNAGNYWGNSQQFYGSLVMVSDSTSTTLADRSGPVLYSKISTSGASRLEARFFSNFDGQSLRRAIIQVTSDDTTAQTFSLDQNGNISSSKGTVQWNGSDVRIKDNFEPAELGHKERIASIGVAEYNYMGSSFKSRGFLAQQMSTVDPKYVFSGGEAFDEKGRPFEVLNVDDRAVIADLVSTVQDLMKEIETLKARP